MSQQPLSRGLSISYEAARETVYGMPFSEWKERYQTEATPEQLAAFAANSQSKSDA